MAMIELLGAPGLLHRDIYFLHQDIPEDDHWAPLSQDPRRPTLKELPVGTHQILAASANPCPFQITVTRAGTIEYERQFEGLLSGNGTNRLTFNGHPVTIDARYVCGLDVSAADGPTRYAGGSQGLWIFLGRSPFPMVRFEETRILPTRIGYGVELGSSANSGWSVNLDERGRWIYTLSPSPDHQPSLDISEGGFLAGQGTSTLEVLGYPCIVDARRSGARTLGVGLVANLLGADTLVQRLNLLPTRGGESPIHYRVFLDGAPGPRFQLANDGTFTAIDAGIEIDTSYHVPRILATG